MGKTTFYELNISLYQSPFKVQRRLIVPANIRLDYLHLAIQEVMGWRNCHLHEFIACGEHFGIPDEDFPEQGVINEKRVRLSKIVTPEAANFRYEYDLGDDWVHKIKVGGFDYQKMPEERLFFCAKGKGACPPEDVGGVFGYGEFCQAINDKSNPQHKAMIRWVYSCCGYPKSQVWPDGFDLDDTNARLMKFEHNYRRETGSK